MVCPARQLSAVKLIEVIYALHIDGIVYRRIAVFQMYPVIFQYSLQNHRTQQSRLRQRGFISTVAKCQHTATKQQSRRGQRNYYPTTSTIPKLVKYQELYNMMVSPSKRQADKKNVWLYFVVRPVSIVSTLPLLKTKITPTQVTIFSVVVSLVAFCLLTIGYNNMWLKVVGWFLFFSLGII